jgi:hypothetical protein
MELCRSLYARPEIALRTAMHRRSSQLWSRAAVTGDAGAFGAPSRLVLCQQIVSTAASRRHARQDVASTCHCRRAGTMWCRAWRWRAVCGGRTRFTRQKSQVRSLSRPPAIAAGQHRCCRSFIRPTTPARQSWDMPGTCWQLCESGSCFPLWLRLLADSLGTRLRVLGDSGSGRCVTVAG